jgi:diacylglycerol kinase family enzyme
MTRSRAAAIVALALGALALAASAHLAIASFPQGLVVGVLLAAAVSAGWYGLTRRDMRRIAGLGCAVLLLVASALLVIANGGILDAIVIAAALMGSAAAARVAFAVRIPLPSAPDPARPVLFFNPKSGGGKARRFNLAEEARARGIEPIELTPGTDLEQLVLDRVRGGADALAMAGGDGSQAIVASIAAERDLPYACIPAGTRNHFALDLGVDRDDLVGSLNAFTGGGERRVDLAEVNGQVFVNNVSLGVYAEAVQREGYREAKLKTILDTLPDVLGPEQDAADLRWREPGGEQHSGGAAILVSNNRYRLGPAVGSGTRPRIDDGVLGVTVVGTPNGNHEADRRPRRPWHEWSTPTFEVTSDRPVPAGIDGEAVVLEPPLRFRIRPGVLRVRIARHHPGCSPSAASPNGVWRGARALVRLAAGRTGPP